MTVAEATSSMAAIFAAPPATSSTPPPPPPPPLRSNWRDERAQILAVHVREKINKTIMELRIPASYRDDDPAVVSQLRDKVEIASRVFEDCSETLNSMKKDHSEKDEALKELKVLDMRINFIGASLPPPPEVTTPLVYDACESLLAYFNSLRSSCEAYVSDGVMEKLDVIAQMLILLGVICHVIIGIATDPCNVIIEAVTLIVKCTMSLHLQKDANGSDTYDTKQQDVLKQLPSSLYVALDRFNIDGKTTMYAVCPSCEHTHKPLNPKSIVPKYPQRCVNRIVEKDGISDCSTELLVLRNGQLRPIRPFLAPSFFDHLARILSDPEIELMCDKACDDAWAARNDPPPPFATNIFEADFMKTFKGPIPGELFIKRGRRMRLPYAIQMDFFPPHGKSMHGNSDSIGILSAANLGIDLFVRYKPEYLYVAILSGPKDPHLDKINGYVKPLIDEAVIAWKRGVHISTTGASPHTGRDVDVAFVLAVNDLPAARKIAGMAGHQSHFFCSVCNCKGIPTMYRTDFGHPDWQPRDPRLLREQAEAWRDATTLKERQEIYIKYGVRWSELWRLPYWNPSRMLVIDSMHCIFEGLAHYHNRYVLELDDEIARAVEKPEQAFNYTWLPYDDQAYNQHVPEKLRVSQKEETQIPKLQKVLETALGGDGGLPEDVMKKRLMSRNLPPLRFLCWALDVLPTHSAADLEKEPMKADYVNSLMNWVGVGRLCSISFAHRPFSAKSCRSSPRITSTVLKRLARKT